MFIFDYEKVTLPWKIEFAGARSSIWDPFEGKRHPLFGNRYSEIEPGLVFLNNGIIINNNRLLLYFLN